VFSDTTSCVVKTRDVRGRWTVRGVPEELRRKASAAARRRGLKLGAWVSEAIQIALDPDSKRKSGMRAKVELSLKTLAARVDRLEKTGHGLMPSRRSRVVAKSGRMVETVPPIGHDGAEFSALFRKFLLFKLMGAPVTKIMDALGVSRDVARLLSTTRVGK
jgi:hypothetical protein